MHKYQPRIHIVRRPRERPIEQVNSALFSFLTKYFIEVIEISFNFKNKFKGKFGFVTIFLLTRNP